MHAIPANPRPLDPTTWARWSALLDQALALDPAARAAWLASQAPADAAALLRCLAAADATDLAPSRPVFEAWLGQALQADEAQVAQVARPAHQAGDAFGPWRLVQPLGQGGMGEVWRAARADGLYDGQAAIKLLRTDLARADLAARFRRERAILSRLNHPGIARLLDAGVQQGQAYLVLELVEGTALLEHARNHCPQVAQRVHLLLQMTQAVAYAHGQLVVHRDIKPSNVVVGQDGAPRLLDFGIAGLLDDGAEGADGPHTALTHQFGRALTPDYAAPEQVLGEPCSAATDTFALGVLLYELLAGEHPFRPAHGGRTAVEHALLHGTPLRLSQRTRQPLPAGAPPGARPVDAHRVPGDLAAVVEKALQKAPAERYTSAQALIDDLQAWLASRPVAALRRSRAHRLRLWWRRHWLPAALGLAAVGALAGGAVLAGWQAQRAQSAAQRATQLAARAEAAAAEAARQGQAAEAARAVADQARARALAQAALAQDRQQQAQAARRQADTQRQRAEAALARERAQQQVLQERTRQVAATNQFLQGLLEGADPERTRGDQLTARELVEAGARRLDELMGAEPALRADLGLTLGRTYLSLGRPEQAEALFDRSLAAAQAVGPAASAQQVQARLGRAEALRMLERYPAADALYRQALDALPRGSLADDERWLMARLNWSYVLGKQGRFDEAVAVMTDAEVFAQTRFGRESWPYIESQNAFVSVASMRGDLGEVPRRLAPLAPLLQRPWPGHAKDAAIIRFNLAVYQLRLGSPREAEASLAGVLAEFVRLLGPDATESLTARWHHGSSLKRLGRTAACQTEFEDIATRRARTSGPGHPLTVDALVQAGLCARYAGRAADARAWLEKAAAGLPAAGGTPQRTVARSLIVLSALAQSQGDTDRARAWRGRGADMLKALNLLDSDEAVLVGALTSLDPQAATTPAQALAALDSWSVGAARQRRLNNPGVVGLWATLAAHAGDCTAAQLHWAAAQQLLARQIDPEGKALFAALAAPALVCPAAGPAPRDPLFYGLF